jgi:hypothetical protein
MKQLLQKTPIFSIILSLFIKQGISSSWNQQHHNNTQRILVKTTQWQAHLLSKWLFCQEYFTDTYSTLQ